jgi:hypothetical protein
MNIKYVEYHQYPTLTEEKPYVFKFIYSSMALQPFVGPWSLLQFLIFFTQTVGLLRRGINPLQGRYLHTGQHNTEYKHTDTSMP